MHFQPRLYRAVNTRGTDVIRDRVSPAAGLTLWRRDSAVVDSPQRSQSFVTAVSRSRKTNDGLYEDLKILQTKSQIPAFYTQPKYPLKIMPLGSLLLQMKVLSKCIFKTDKCSLTIES
jgi:hypothetical protein